MLYRGTPGDGPRVECPTYLILSNQSEQTSVLLFSKTGAPGFSTNGVYWATGKEVNGSLIINRTGRQQSGGYANEAMEVEPGRWLVFSWISGVKGSTDCINSLNRTLKGW